MNSFTIVRPEHLNHFGYLFGGQLLKWVDEVAWMAAARDFPGYHLVTRAMDEIDFKTRVASGAILRFDARPARQGRTSVSYGVDVFADEPGATEEKPVFSTCVTFVCVDDRGDKRTLPPREPRSHEPKDEEEE
jgi:acyl-CoA hydrolase